jgi:hypothetical protein
MMAKIMKLVSLLETLLETIENNEMILTSETLENLSHVCESCKLGFICCNINPNY